MSVTPTDAADQCKDDIDLLDLTKPTGLTTKGHLIARKSIRLRIHSTLNEYRTKQRPLSVPYLNSFGILIDDFVSNSENLNTSIQDFMIKRNV